MKLELPDNRVIVPLSGEITGEQCKQLIPELAPHLWGFKLHPTTVIRMMRRDVFDPLECCMRHNARIFIDLKGFDIPSEIANMIRDLEESADIDIVTLHQSGGDDMVSGAGSVAKRTMIFPVTILTTMQAMQASITYGHPERNANQRALAQYRDQKIKQFAQEAFDCNAHGTISSAADLQLFDSDPERFGNQTMLRCTPGIRPLDAAIQNDDQDRVLTPAKAARAGANLVVVGRPVLQADDPVSAAQAIQTEFWEARSVA